ncbi:MAG: hypothetical protein QOE58_2697 [Actinomycetota bacterium]|jgi:lysophospholipase L1-like esterase|nr:hypothetical protein [Actinomycetota bacterium]
MKPLSAITARKYTRRHFAGLVVAGGIAIASPSIDAWAASPTMGAAGPVGTGLYGSGTLGNWAGLSQKVSTPATISRAVSSFGLWGFGDSIGVGTFKDLAVRLGSRTFAVNAKSGRPTAPAVDILSQWAAAHGLPKQILMAVGSNDIFDPFKLAAQIDRVMKVTGPNVIVYWPEIHVSRWKLPVGVQIADQRNSGCLNAQLHAAAAKHETLKIIRWASFLAERPTYRIGTYLTDGVHTSAAGMAARNSLIVPIIQSHQSR